MFKTHDENDNETNFSHQSTEAETIIGPLVKVEGDFVGKGNIIVHGEIIGNLKTDKSVSIEEGAKIHADVSANDIRVAGEIEGKIDASERLELASSAKIKGDISAKIFVVNAGAVFNGQCGMDNAQTGADFKTENKTEEQSKKKNKEDD